MEKNDILKNLENAVKDYQSFLGNKSTSQDFRPCEFGFCWYFKRKGFRYDYEGFNAIISELEKDKVGENHDDNHWYPTIYYDGYSNNNEYSFIEKRFGLNNNKVKTNNEILQKQIDHLNRTIQRLKNQNLCK